MDISLKLAFEESANLEIHMGILALGLFKILFTNLKNGQTKIIIYITKLPAKLIHC